MLEAGKNIALRRVCWSDLAEVVVVGYAVVNQ